MPTMLHVARKCLLRLIRCLIAACNGHCYATRSMARTLRAALLDAQWCPSHATALAAGAVWPHPFPYAHMEHDTGMDAKWRSALHRRRMDVMMR